MSVRYAPSPTGRLHLGNLRTAWISRQWADTLGMPWVVRFEDIDRPRVLPGSREEQLSDLAALGLVPDRIYLQSDRIERHWELFERAVAEGVAYPCFCSRKEIRDAIEASASAPHREPPAYNGRCRTLVRTGRTAGSERPDLPSVAWRFRGPREDGAYDVVVARTAKARPDRASFVPSYPFACAIDDLDGGYVLLVRAWDLATAVDAQRRIQAWILSEPPENALAEKFPAVFHTSLVVQDDGHRLEKRTRGVTLPELAARGIGTDEILRKFQSSYAYAAARFSSGEIFGETERERTLRSLGF